jgi:hypothetical protein
VPARRRAIASRAPANPLYTPSLDADAAAPRSVIAHADPGVGSIGTAADEGDAQAD